MKKRTIQVSFSYTANLGNYESVKIQAGIERDIEENEDKDQAYETEHDYLRDFVMTKIEELEQNKG